MVGGLESVTIDQFTRSRISEKSDFGVSIPGKSSAASQGKPTTRVAQRTKQYNEVQNSSNYCKNIQKTTLIPHTSEAHIEKSSYSHKGESSSKNVLSRSTAVPKMSESDPTNLLANSSKSKVHPRGTSSSNHSEKGTKTFTTSGSYSEWITKPPPTNTLPLPDATDTTLQNGIFSHVTTDLEESKSGYHLPQLKTVPSYVPTHFKEQKAENVDNIITNSSSENIQASHFSIGTAYEGAISSDELFTKVSSVDYMNVKDSFEARKLIDKMRTDLLSDSTDETLYALNENYLPFQNLSPAQSSSQHQETPRNLLVDELRATTVPPPSQFGDTATPKGNGA